MNFSPIPSPLAEPVADAPANLAPVKILRRIAGLCPVFWNEQTQKFNVVLSASREDALNADIPRPAAHILYVGITPLVVDYFAPSQGSYSVKTLETWEIVILSSDYTNNRGERGEPALLQSLRAQNEVIAACIGWVPDDDDPKPKAGGRRAAVISTAALETEGGEKLASIVTLNFPNEIIGAQGHEVGSTQLNSIQMRNAQKLSEGATAHTNTPE